MRTSRRESLRLLAGASWARRDPCGPPAAEAPSETTRLRLSRVPTICLAPQYIAEALLRGEGFTDIQYIGEGSSHTGIPAYRVRGRWALANWTWR